MICPQCGDATQTLETRHVEDFVRRRCRCKKCDYRFSTKEVVFEYPAPAVRAAKGRETLRKVRTAAEARRQLEERKDNAGIDE